MHDKVSLWTLFGVAAIALVLMASISNNGVTGEITGPRPPRAIPAPRPPPRPVVVDRPDTIVVDEAAQEAMADEMAELQASVCYLINLQLDRQAGRDTPPQQISNKCPAWV